MLLKDLLIGSLLYVFCLLVLNYVVELLFIYICKEYFRRVFIFKEKFRGYFWVLEWRFVKIYGKEVENRCSVYLSLVFLGVLLVVRLELEYYLWSVRLEWGGVDMIMEIGFDDCVRNYFVWFKVNK